MRIIFLSILGYLSSSFLMPESPADENSNCRPTKISTLEEFINPEVLAVAFKGYAQIQDSSNLKGNFLAIVDFSKSSTEKRFYLLNMNDSTLLHSDFVSHGKYSGDLYANEFSNNEHSLKSSLGFYRIAESYMGCHGLSIRLDGMDKGYNDKARTRAIVMHAANYAEPTKIKELGRLGKSFGCPALPVEGFSFIARNIKENDILFHYYPDENYIKSCVWLR